MGVEAAIFLGATSAIFNLITQTSEDNESIRQAVSERDQAIRDFYGDDMAEGGDAASGGVEGEYRLRMAALDREREEAVQEIGQARTLLGINTGAQARNLIESTSDSIEQAKMQGIIASGQASAAMGRSGAEVGIGTARAVVGQTSREAQKLIDKINDRFAGRYADIMGEHGARIAGYDAAEETLEANYATNRSLLTNTFNRNKAAFEWNKRELEGYVNSMLDPGKTAMRLMGYAFGGAAQGLQIARMGYEAFQPTKSLIPPL